MTIKITFTPAFEVEDTFYPQPALNNIPDWYKKTPSYLDSKNFSIRNNQGNQTVKKCIPVFDAMTAGYIIKTYVDVFVTKLEDGLSYYNWPNYDPIKFHENKQANFHPLENRMPYPKWINPWSIKTDPGYSCLFIPPMHNSNKIFTILPGIVDTDIYNNEVHFPFVLNDPNFEGMIPAGTPMVQVIPFKRDSYKMKIGNEKEIKRIAKIRKIYNNRWVNNYRNRFWHKKEYR